MVCVFSSLLLSIALKLGFFFSSSLDWVTIKKTNSHGEHQLSIAQYLCFMQFIPKTGEKAFSKKASQKIRILNFITWEFEVQNFIFFFILLQNVPDKNMALLLGSDQLWIARRDFLVLQIFSDYVFCFRQLLSHGSSIVSHWNMEALSSVVSRLFCL